MGRELAGWNDPTRRLREVLERNELVLYCQPVAALAGGGYPMAEILVRLREEEAALAPPGEFLPVFEHFGMMPELDRWVVAATLARLGQGSRIPRLSVNVSGQTLGDREFPAFVSERLRAGRVTPDALVLEIDESDVLQRPGMAEAFARAMKGAGCLVLIDGFGRRAVSFAPLKTLRTDFLKVDGIITRNLLRSAVSLKKLKAILRVGDTLGIGIIAECVEEQDVLARLKALGVRYAQGFGIMQPYPIEVLAPR